MMNKNNASTIKTTHSILVWLERLKSKKMRLKYSKHAHNHTKIPYTIYVENICMGVCISL